MTEDSFADIRDAIIGLLFLGTPHFGSDLAYPVARLAGLFGTMFASSDLLLRSMTPEDAGLTNLHQRFSMACERDSSKEKELDLWRNSSRFYEERPAMLLGLVPLGRVRFQAKYQILDILNRYIPDRCNQFCVRWTRNVTWCCAEEGSFRPEQIRLPK